jgi:glycosyltransferase involved in cell wall biosynthesis
MMAADAAARPRVAVVSRAVMPLHGLGGLERSTRDLVRHLASAGADVTLITPPPARDRLQIGEDPFASRRITIRHVPYITFPFANRRGTTVLDRNSAYLVWARRAGRLALSLVTEGQIDIVHSQGAAALGYARARAARTASAPLVLNPHGLEEFGATGGGLPRAKRLGYAPLRRAVRACARAADCVIATDRSLEPVIVRHLEVPPDRVRTVPNGIDLQEASALAGPPEGAILRRRHGIAPHELVLLSVGRLEANKGFDLVPPALALAREQATSLAAIGWRWVLVGSGPHQRSIEAAVESHGLGTHVVLTGRVDDRELHAWYEAASLFLHPTRYEGSSLVTLEAMSHRKPVIATRAGGLPDKVRPDVNGWLVDPDDVAGLAAAIADAAGQTRRLGRMGAKSREIVEQEFGWTAVVAKQLAVYAELLGERPS